MAIIFSYCPYHPAIGKRSCGFAEINKPIHCFLYRNYSASWAYDEENLNERFRVRATPFQPDRVETDWDWYILG